MTTHKLAAPRMTSPEERAPLYAAYAASRQRGEEIGYHCPDDSIIQYAVRAYDKAKYGTEALALPDWLVDLIHAAATASEDMACDGRPDYENGDGDPEDGPTSDGHDEGCDRCAWEALYAAVPQRTKVLAEQARALNAVRVYPEEDR